jgi:hypothetical protein
LIIVKLNYYLYRFSLERQNGVVVSTPDKARHSLAKFNLKALDDSMLNKIAITNSDNDSAAIVNLNSAMIDVEVN